MESLTEDIEPRRLERPGSASRGREELPTARARTRQSGDNARQRSLTTQRGVPDWAEELYDEDIEAMPDAARAGPRGMSSNGRLLEPATESRSRAPRTVSSADEMEIMGPPDDGSGSWSSARLQQFANAGGLAA